MNRFCVGWHYLGLISLFFISSISGNAQNILIEGKVIDGSTTDPLPYASISLKHHSFGTSANQNGLFVLNLEGERLKDTLVISYMGYEFKEIAVQNFQNKSTISLSPYLVELSEMLVYPLPPTAYIKRAVRRVTENYPKKPFESISYYNESLTENGNFLKGQEAIFKSYYPSFQDTTKNQHQAVLHREVEDVEELAFMKRKREKQYEKELKKAQRKGDTSKIIPPGMEVNNLFGGPNAILSLYGGKKQPSFMDSTEFNNYRYYFRNNTQLRGRDVMVIGFESKGSVEHIKSTGSVLIDVNTYAVVGIDFNGRFIIPLYIKPILLTIGLRIKKPVVNYNVRFEEFENVWYPKNFQWSVEAKLIKTYWFNKNEHGRFVIGQSFIVNEIKTENIKAIPLKKRLNTDKKLKEQVYPEPGMHWYGK